MSSTTEKKSPGILDAVAKKLGIKDETIKEERLDERATTKVDEEAKRRFSHASKQVWKMDREA